MNKIFLQIFSKLPHETQKRRLFRYTSKTSTQSEICSSSRKSLRTKANILSALTFVRSSRQNSKISSRHKQLCNITRFCWTNSNFFNDIPTTNFMQHVTQILSRECRNLISSTKCQLCVNILSFLNFEISRPQKRVRHVSELRVLRLRSTPLVSIICFAFIQG